ncbi:MAG TPA: hypothetical protein G4O02_15315 [Caldilineae bacterium]|nr:hypothetical protein [Caldilineae bacterium]
MGGVITALRFQKRSREWVNVHIDGRFAFAIPAAEAARLHKGQELTDEEIARLKAIRLEQKAFERALHLLRYRPRSIAEVKDHLRSHRVDDAIIQRVIERLQRIGYLDDKAFARFWVENRQQFNPRGLYALRQELRSKGVPPEVIEETLAAMPVDEEAVAYELISARRQRWDKLDRSTFWRKARGYLARRGFSYEAIDAALQRLWAELEADRESPDIDIEYES